MLCIVLNKILVWLMGLSGCTGALLSCMHMYRAIQGKCTLLCFDLPLPVLCCSLRRGAMNATLCDKNEEQVSPSTCKCTL